MDEEGQPRAAVDVDAHPSPAAPSQLDDVSGAPVDVDSAATASIGKPSEPGLPAEQHVPAMAQSAEPLDDAMQADKNPTLAHPTSKPSPSTADPPSSLDALGAQAQEDAVLVPREPPTDLPTNLSSPANSSSDPAPVVDEHEPVAAVVEERLSLQKPQAPWEQEQDNQAPHLDHTEFNFDQEPVSDTNLEWMQTGDTHQTTSEEPVVTAEIPSMIESFAHDEEPPTITSQEEYTNPVLDTQIPDQSFDQMLAQPVEALENANTVEPSLGNSQLDALGDLEPVGTTPSGTSPKLDAVAYDYPDTESLLEPPVSHGTDDFVEPTIDSKAVAESDTLSWINQPAETLPWMPNDQPSEIAKSEAPGFDTWTTDDPLNEWANDVGSTSKTLQPAADIEDSWSKAFGSPEDGLDDSWNAAFADGFDDEDGLLGETSTQPPMPQQSPLLLATPPMQPSQSSLMPNQSSAYSATPPIATSSAKQPSAPMQFFAELPSATVRSRKSRQQALPPPKPSAPPPPTQPRQLSPEQTVPTPMQFRAPDRMDPFPAQPSVPVPSPSTSYSSGPVPQQAAQNTSRYSPGPTTLPASYAGSQTAQPQSAASSRYSSFAPRPSDVKPTPPPPSRSPYAPAPAAPSGPKFPYATPPASSGTDDPLKRPSAPPAPTHGMHPAIGDFRTPSMPYERPPQDVPNQMGYSSAPHAPPPTNRFAPRTSSPLAQQGYRPTAERSIATSVPHQELHSGFNERRDSLPEQTRNNQSYAHGVNATSPNSINQYGPVSGPPPAQSPSTTYNTQQPATNLPQSQSQAQASIPPPQRPQTSSPSASTRQPPASTAPLPRAVSVQAQYSSHTNLTNAGWMPHSLPDHQVDNADFVLPTDETAQDPLQRWKGSPIFHWGPGGVVVTSLPKLIPRYGGGQAAPKMKPVTGEFKLQRSKEFFSFQEQLPPFPGPLKSKGKKKDVITWLAAVVGVLEQHIQQTPLTATAEWTRLEERVVLWKVMKVLVEFDGSLAGNPAVEAAAREALKPHSTASPPPANPVVQPSTSMRAEPTDPAAIYEIKQHLLQGNREKAIWYAVDNHLWAHAMLLSPTAGPTIWKQVAQEFVKKEVRNSEQDNQSLAALYQVLAGNWDESIDELVPLSARSGFQMISTAATPAQARDAFDGLNKWRETLSLILSNRSAEDENGILSLGKLLAGSGRVEASHVCFLFAKSLAPFGGADDPQTVISLLGIDHTHPWSNGGADADAIRLSEVYEFALSLGPTATYYVAPHLQAYKLQHALSLAESGQRAEALQYCEVIASAMKSTTRLSPYYNVTLVSQLDDLQRRLSQSPKDGSSSWISRPSIGKVSSSMGTWFNSFVAGDDNDGASTGSGHQSEAESGPFARISGGTPIISRSTSTVDLRGGDISKPNVPTTAGASRYAPAAYAPRPLQNEDLGTQGSFTPYSSSPEQRYGSYSPRQAGDNASQSYGSPPKFARQPSHLSHNQSYSPQTRPDSASSSGPRPLASYEPYVPSVHEEPTPSTYPQNAELAPPLTSDSTLQEQKSNGYTTAANGYDPSFGGYQPSAIMDQEQNGSGYNPPNGLAAVGSDYEPPQVGYQPFEPPQSSYEPPSGGYEPPTGGYEPYQPDMAVAEGTAEDGPPKRSIMDDDEDGLSSQAQELKKQEKAARDKAADEAFRAAAEADAARDKAKKDGRSSSGWFGGIGGFFGGKKDPNAPTVHKAKLGEESSFYFDTETKKWVNRKGGASPAPSASAAAPPPPPRSSAPPSRNVSAATDPPSTSAPSMPPTGPSTASSKPPPSSYPVREAGASGPPSRSGTPASVAGSIASDMHAAGEPPAPGLPSSTPASGPPSAPQSRPPTSMSDASSIDDLIGVPQARKGGTIKKGKKGQRYIDVMAK